MVENLSSVPIHFKMHYKSKHPLKMILAVSLKKVSDGKWPLRLLIDDDLIIMRQWKADNERLCAISAELRL